jgi:hypothetical protein
MKSIASAFLVSIFVFSAPSFAMGEKVSAQQPASSETSTASSDSVWVMRPDGSQSCSAKSGESLDGGSDDLKHANIRVLDSKKSGSLKLHSQLCGMPTGTSNAYLISRADLPRALTMGYQQAK